MTDVRKSKLSANERSKSSPQFQKSEAKKQKGSVIVPPSRDDSSVYSSESESSSSETTGDNCSSRSRNDADYLLADSNNFEERAKRFVETMPAERRKEWLGQQGYTYNREGLLIPPTQIRQSSVITETSFQSNLQWRKFAHRGGSGNSAYGGGDENHNYAVEQTGTRGQDSESRSESYSTLSHDPVSASSDAEEDGCQVDNKSDAGNNGHWAEVAERPGSESPNAVIQNRFARLMARMSDVGGGFPEMGDMEITTVHDENLGSKSERSTNELPRNNKEAAPLQWQTDNVECIQSGRNKVKPDKVSDVDQNDRGVSKNPLEKKVVFQDAHIKRQQVETPATSKYSDMPGVNSKLKEAYRPVVDEAVVSVLGDLNMAQRAKGLHADKSPTHGATRSAEFKAEARRNNAATPKRGEAIVKQRRDSGGTYVIADQTSLSATDDRGTTRSNSTRGDPLNDEASPLVNKQGDLQRVVDQVSECKETPQPLAEGENSQDSKSRSVECEDALVTFKNQDCEQRTGSSGVATSQNSNCYKHRLDVENFQNVNGNFQDYGKRVDYQVQRGLSDNGELSQAEIRLADLRKLVDKELVKSVLRNSQFNTDLSCDTRVPANNSQPCSAEPKNKQGGVGRKKNESYSASPCFVTGNKMTVSKKILCGNISKTVPVPVPRAKISATKSLLEKSATNNNTVIVEKRPMKKAVACVRLETIPETSSVSSCQSSDTSNAQGKLISERISCAIKVNKNSKVNRQSEVPGEKLSGFEGSKNECLVKKAKQDGSDKDKHTSNTHSSPAHTGILAAQQANKAERTTEKLKLPLIKTTTNKTKTGPEKSTNASFKLPKIKTEENQQAVGQARAHKEATTERGFLPPVSNDTRRNVSVTYKNPPVHLPNVQRSTVESTKSKGVSDMQNDTRNNVKKESLIPAAFNLASNQCGERELKPKQALQRKLPDIAEKKHGDSELKQLKKDAEVSSTHLVTKDAKIKQGFNQIEAEIQREIDTKLKQAKQTESATPKGCIQKSLSAKKTCMVNAKMDILDEITEDDGEAGEEEGEDESEFLSRIVSSDSRLTMYGHTKDTPLIRMIGASTLDAMKESLGVGDVSKNGKVKKAGGDCDASAADKVRQSAKGKVSYKDIKSNALRAAKQRALLTTAQDADEGSSTDSDAMLNKSSNALVARDDIAHGVESTTLLDNRCKEEIRDICDRSEDFGQSILDQADTFDVDVLILDESSYTYYGNSPRRHCHTCRLNRLCDTSMNLTKEHNTNANNSKGGSDVEENLTPNHGLSEQARGTIVDKDNRHCLPSSLVASKELRTPGSNKDTARSSRIPIRAGTRKKYEQTKASSQVTRPKTVSFQCDKIPQKLVVILNNRDGLKVGQAEAPIIFTDNEAIRYCNQAGGSSNRDDSYTVEIRGESTEPAHAAASPANLQEDEWRKLPLSERLKKYQKAKPRNIHSGTYHKADRAVSADAKQRAHNSNGQQCLKPPSLEKTSLGKKNGPELPATDDKMRDARGTPRQTHHDLVRNMPLHSSASPKRTHHKPLLRPELSPQADNINTSTNLIFQCELFSASSSLCTTQDHEDDLPVAESIDAVKACSTSKKNHNGQIKNSDAKAPDEKPNLEQKEDTAFEGDIKSPCLVVDYMQSSRRRTVVDSDNPVKSLRSAEYEPTPDVDDSLQIFLQHEQTLAQAQTPSEATSESDDPDGVRNCNIATSTSGEYDSDEEEGLCKRSSWPVATRSPALTADERREDDDMGASSPKRHQYRDSLKYTPIHISSSEDEGHVEQSQGGNWQGEQSQEEQAKAVQGQEEEDNEVKSTYLHLIYSKVKNHFFKRSKDDPHNSPAKHTITAEDGANHETHVVYEPREELRREDESSTTPVELDGRSPDDAGISYDDRAQHSLHSNDDSIEKTYSIATEKQAPDAADTKDTDYENISVSDVTTNENHPQNTRTSSAKSANKTAVQLRHKNHMDPKQIVLKKMASGFAPIPATSSPIRSKQAKRPKGNLFDKVAFTSEESLAEGAGPSSKYAATLLDANKNESRISVEKDEAGGEHCDFEKRRRPETKLCSSRATVQNRKDFKEGSSVRLERNPVACTVRKASHSRVDICTPCTRHVGASSSGQSNHCPRSSAPSATEALHDGERNPARAYTDSPVKVKHSPREAESPQDAHGSAAIHAEFSPWPHHQEARDEGLAATTTVSPTRPSGERGNNDRDLDARRKKTNSHLKPDTLPPLSNRQTGLPHRPKVKRYY